MNLEWNLKNLFKSNDDFYAEIEKVKMLVTDIKKYDNLDLNEETLCELLDKKWIIKKLANNVLIYGSLMYYKNIKSDVCIHLKKDAEKLSNDINISLNFIDTKIINLKEEKINEFIRKNSNLKIYELSINNLFRKQKHLQDEETNQKINDNNNRINEQLSLYNNLLRDIKYGIIDIDDNEIEIKASNFGKYLSSRDAETRKNTYLTVNKSFENYGDDFTSILNTIYDYRLENTQLEKYNSVLEKVLYEENIDPEIIFTLISSVNNNLDLIHKYLKIKSDFLGIENPHVYDFGVPLDNNLKIKYTLDEGIEIIKNALKPLGKEYLEVVNNLLDGHIDAVPSDDKHQSIIFSWHTYSFMNFRGSYIDLKNLIHEIGHIVNYYLSMKKQPFIYEDSTIFVGETASLINEILLNRYLLENANTIEEQIFYLSKEIENYFTSVFKQTMYTEFENDLYSAKKTSSLSYDLLNQKYSEIIKKYYGDRIIYDDECKIEWTRLGHLYRWSYYPYKYATGLLIASTVVNSLLDEKTLSKDRYLEFLSSGSSLYSLDLLKLLDIDLTDNKVIDNGFKVLDDDIKKLNHILTLKKDNKN